MQYDMSRQVYLSVNVNCLKLKKVTNGTFDKLDYIYVFSFTFHVLMPIADIEIQTELRGYLNASFNGHICFLSEPSKDYL